MKTTVYIYSEKFSPAIRREGRGGLEDDLDDFLGSAGTITGGGGGGRGWNIDLELIQDPEIWIDKICEFLRNWGVAKDTYLCIYPENADGEEKPREIMVFDQVF